MVGEPREMNSRGVAQLQASMARFLAHWKASGGHLVYKHHAAWHLVARAGWHGKPRFYWTYSDEQTNRAMSTVAKALHGGPTFYLRFLQRVFIESA